jgi:hypothetical protein
MIMVITQLQCRIVVTVRTPDSIVITPNKCNDNGNYTITGLNRRYGEKPDCNDNSDYTMTGLNRRYGEKPRL